jgi:hypothetical protein
VIQAGREVRVIVTPEQIAHHCDQQPEPHDEDEDDHHIEQEGRQSHRMSPEKPATHKMQFLQLTVAADVHNKHLAEAIINSRPGP